MSGPSAGVWEAQERGGEKKSYGFTRATATKAITTQQFHGMFIPPGSHIFQIHLQALTPALSNIPNGI